MLYEHQLLRLMIREALLYENPSVSSNEVLAKNAFEKTIDQINTTLGVIDIAAVGLVFTPADPVACLWLIGSGVAGGIVNGVSLAYHLSVGDKKQAAIDLLEIIASVCMWKKLQAAGRTASLAWDTVQGIISIIEGVTGDAFTPSEKAEIEQERQRKLANAPRVVDLNEIIASIVDPEHQPASKDELLDLISGDVTVSALSPKQEEELYQIYLQYYKDFQIDDNTGSPVKIGRPMSQKKVSTRSNSLKAPGQDVITSKSFKFDSTGLLYNGPYVLGDIHKMKSGDSIEGSGLKFAKALFDDQGEISKVFLKNRNGSLVEVPKFN